MVRTYAPLAQRVDAMVRLLEGAPKLLAEGEARLAARLPEPFLKLTLAIAGGLSAHFAEAEAVARGGSASLGDRVAAARGPAEEAVRKFVEKVEKEDMPRQIPHFALGTARFQRLLWVRAE